jgi:RNA polymerase sigma-70 factor (ECF subfamily)
MSIDADEAALAAGFAAHQRWAFDEAYRRYGRLLFSAAVRLLGNTQDAEDCVHDSLVRIWRAVQAYTTQRGPLRSFLTVCVRNEAISRMRSANRRTRVLQRAAREPQEHDEIAFEDFVEHGRLKRALAQLPDVQRAPLELAYFGGKTHVEIANALDQPLGTIKSRIALGLRKLAAVMKAPETA